MSRPFSCFALKLAFWRHVKMDDTYTLVFQRHIDFRELCNVCKTCTSVRISITKRSFILFLAIFFRLVGWHYISFRLAFYLNFRLFACHLMICRFVNLRCIIPFFALNFLCLFGLHVLSLCFVIFASEISPYLDFVL